MAVSFVSASSQYINNAAAPVTAIPFSVGFWFKMPTGGSDPTLWSLSDTAGDVNQFYIFLNASNQIVIGALATTPAETATTTAITSDAWAYVVARFISATNRRISVRHASGVIDNAQNTTSKTPASIDAVTLGASGSLTKSNYIDGSIAEYWMANVDIHRGGGALPATYLHQLAFNGPFSVPFIERNLVDYRSFRQSITSDQDHGDDYFPPANRPVRQVWTNVNSATLGPHPPLPGSYERWNRQQMPVLV